MDVEAPEWITKDFLKTALQSGTDEIQIDNFEVKKAVPKGTNFMCDLFRVKVCYRSKISDLKEISVIVKAPIRGGLSEMVFDFGLVQNEQLIYDVYLPKLRCIVNDDLTPRSYRCDRENVLVLEDLNYAGFKMANRIEKLDFDHCRLCLMALAKFHAASVKILEENPELIDTIGKERLYRPEMKCKYEFLAQCQIEILQTVIMDWPEMAEYMSPLNKLREKSFDLLTEMYANNEDEFRVLNHGDFWVTNFLFKYDESGNPNDIKIIDLQLTRFTSPAADLIYLMQGSAQEDVRLHRYDELLKIYLESLNNYITQFKCKSQKLQEAELRRSIRKREFQEFYTNITLVPVVINDSSDDQIMDIKKMTEKDIKENIANNQFRKYLQTENYRKLFVERFKNEFVNHAWFNELIEDIANA